MTIHRLTASEGGKALHLIGNWREPDERCRIVLGVGYTESERIAEWAAEHDYDVAVVDEIPEAFAEQLGRVDAWPHEIALWPRDGADPDSHYRFSNSLGANTTRAGRSTSHYIDIRDVLSGAVTA